MSQSCREEADPMQEQLQPALTPAGRPPPRRASPPARRMIFLGVGQTQVPARGACAIPTFTPE